MNLITEMEEEKRNSFPFPLFVIFFLLSIPGPLFVHSQCIQKPVIFNFGDSNSDTGGLSEGLGIKFGLPTGRTFFHKPAGRLCDGRLMIDFLCTYSDPTKQMLNSLIFLLKCKFFLRWKCEFWLFDPISAICGPKFHKWSQLCYIWFSYSAKGSSI